MRRNRWTVRGLLLVVMLAAALAPVARADEWIEPPEAERWWGVAGAALCGGEMLLIRTAPVVGMNPYVLAAGIGGCLLAALDAAT